MEKNKNNLIRNFSIIAHINHGKSTLADRIIELTQNRKEEKLNKIMDSLKLEQERGITIKLNAARLFYNYQGEKYELNLIDTPGHVDFAYEVSRSLAACEGVLLLVDAAQGIQAQTISNLKEALKNNLKIIPVINKIDLKYVEIEKVKNQIKNILNINESEILLISAKNNIGITPLIEQIIERIPAPAGSNDNDLQALIFDAYYDRYQGVMMFVRVVNGKINKKNKIKMFQGEKEYEIINLWIKKPELEKIDELKTGEVGLIQTGIKNMNEVKIGDTITTCKNPSKTSLKGYKKNKPVVFANFFPVSNEDFKNLEIAVQKIQLTDGSFVYQKTSSLVFGQGFHCGFLGLLHLEIIRDRIIEEQNVEIIATTPSVEYKFIQKDGKINYGTSGKNISDWNRIKTIEEIICMVEVWTPIKYLGDVLDLIKKKRGIVEEQNLITDENLQITAKLPLIEIVINFFDMLKSITNGYASFQYEIFGYSANKLVRLDILVNGEKIDAFSQIVPSVDSYHRGRNLCQKLQKIIPRQNFKISVQAAVNNKIIARENITALRKAVAAKCYGGDISRKKKLWKKQKKGKIKMKKFGNVEMPNKIFIQVLKN